ncbi:Insect cuticle protein [Popillia japonica]|uniref:Insect cuticle protein n=1 Tax=Popillia japonica TaxID=7064 RepID=A0AAW1KI77_POPJA
MNLRVLFDELGIIVLVLVAFGMQPCFSASHNEVMYSFRYGVEAPHLGLLTHHYEERKGDLVRGSYSLLERDGRIRIVEYKVDGKRGFRAFVTYRKPPGQPLRGHLNFPHYYKHPIHLAQPVGFITSDILRGRKTYPNVPV